MGNAGHAQVHTDLAALAGEVGLQLLQDICLVLGGNVGVVGNGLLVDAQLMLGSQLALFHDLELRTGDLADGADEALRHGFSFQNITANRADKFLHNNILRLIFICCLLRNALIYYFRGFLRGVQALPAESRESQLGLIDAAAEKPGVAAVIRLVHLGHIQYRAASAANEMHMGLDVAIEALHAAHRCHAGDDSLALEERQIPVDRCQGDIRVLLPEHLVELLGAGVARCPPKAGQDGIPFAKLFGRFQAMSSFCLLFASDYHLRHYSSTVRPVCQEIFLKFT